MLSQRCFPTEVQVESPQTRKKPRITAGAALRWCAHHLPTWNAKQWHKLNWFALSERYPLSKLLIKRSSSHLHRAINFPEVIAAGLVRLWWHKGTILIQAHFGLWLFPTQNIWFHFILRAAAGDGLFQLPLRKQSRFSHHKLQVHNLSSDEGSVWQLQSCTRPEFTPVPRELGLCELPRPSPAPALRSSHHKSHDKNWWDL